MTEVSLDKRYLINTLTPIDLSSHEELVFDYILQFEQICKDNLREIVRPSIYAGACGIALMCFKVGDSIKHLQHLTKAKKITPSYYYEQALMIIEKELPKFSSSKLCTFTEGKAGALALQIACLQRLDLDIRKPLSEFMKIAKATSQLRSNECEILYGRAGFLSALHFIRQHTQLETHELFFEESANLVYQIIKEGLQFSEQHKSPLPLCFAWHDKIYIGAAHGITGILTMLLHFQSCFPLVEKKLQLSGGAIKKLIIDTTQALLELAVDDKGNVLSAFSSKQTSNLIQWCHGPPGLLILLLTLHETLQKDYNVVLLHKKKLDLMAQAIWEKGILLKGLGLCHGIPGNGLVLLHYGIALQKQEWIFKAHSYAMYAAQQYKAFINLADEPYSMFEGFAGLVWFLCACLTTTPNFPGF